MACKKSENSDIPDRVAGKVDDELFQVQSGKHGFTVYFNVSGENFPRQISVVVVISKENTRIGFLESHLKNIRLESDCCDPAMICNILIEEAERIFEELNQNQSFRLNDSNTFVDDGGNEMISDETKAFKNHEPICKYFLKGICRFGDECFNSHSLAPCERSDGGSEHPALDLVCIGQTLECDGQKKTYKKKKSKPLDSEKHKKKPPMKTATDVINRIQWDEKLNPEHFTVGYLDRFLGVIENSFSSFDWDDVTSMDQAVLAIPRHRIQYFKYCDEIVWDKNKRLDCVFGSTGSGQTILDIIERIDENKGPD